MNTELSALLELIKEKSAFVDRITNEISKVIVGQRSIVC
jgi:hypothetical protein